MQSTVNYYLILILLVFINIGCSSKKSKAETLYFNANIYTVDTTFSKATAMLVNKGKIIALGKVDALREKYEPIEEIDLKGNTVIPGFIDVHTHFYEYAKTLNRLDLSHTTSLDEILASTKTHHKNTNGSVVLGYGWDHTKWNKNDLPINNKLNTLFPDTPVILMHKNGHVLFVNEVVMNMAKITTETKIEGGEIMVKDGKPTGVLIDNAMKLVEELKLDQKELNMTPLLQKAEQHCLSSGVTSINDLGWFTGDLNVLDLFDSLYQSKTLKIRNYVSLFAKRAKGIEYIKKGKYIESDRFTAKAIKIITDGALGSRSACLITPYHDQHDQHGVMTVNPDSLLAYAQLAYDNNFQVMAHAIGDSANRTVLRTFSKILPKNNDRRWRVEHAQIVDPIDLKYFKDYNIIPSIQPTHAIADLHFSTSRLGHDRVKHAYGYKTLLQQNNWLAIGTDFPVEAINPLMSFYTAVARKDANGHPENGFQMENALSRKETLKGMTIWAAKAQFREHIIGSLEAGKYADFVVLDKDLMTIPLNDIPQIKILYTYIQGEQLYAQ